MKATLKGKIISVQNTEGDSILTFKSTGKVDRTGFGPGSSDARKTSLDGTVELKAILAKEMKIGAVLTITISDEDEDERVD
jgi:hypothetical protein